MPSADYIAHCKWLTEAELEVYASEYGRTGFNGALQGYRAAGIPKLMRSMQTFSGRTIDVPSSLSAGKSDWGVYQTAGAVDRMRETAPARKWRASTWWMAPGIGSQQEQPEEVSRLLVEFLRDYAKA